MTYRTDKSTSPPIGGQTMKKQAAPANPIASAMQGQPRHDAFIPVVPAGHYEHLHQISGEPYATQPVAAQTLKPLRQR